MTVTHNFTLVTGWDDTTGWTGSNDVTPTSVSEPRLEGTGAVSIVKSGTSEQWFYAEYTPSSPLDVSNGKMLVFYIYIRPTVIHKLRYFRVKVYDSSGKNVALVFDHKLAGGGWKPVIINSNTTTSINWSTVSKLQLIFYTPSPGNTFQQGDIVVDRLLAGNGFYVLYSSEAAPDTLEELARLDEQDGLMLIQAVNRNMYIVKARINIGNGTDTGALKISQSLVAFDGTDMMQWWDVLIWVYQGSSLTVENSILVLAERPEYPHGSGIFRMYDTSHVVLKNTYVVTDAPVLFGSGHFSFWTGYLEMEDVLTNFQFSLLRYFTSTGYIGILPYGRMTFDDIHVSDYMVQATLYIFKNAEFVGRETVTVRVSNPVLAGGSLTADAGTTLIVYDPVNLHGLDGIVTKYNYSTVKIYYTIDLYIIDRLGVPIVNATVKIYDKNGSETAEATTDSNGYAQIHLLVYEKQNDSNGTLVVNEDYNPFTIEVWSGESILAKTRMEVRERLTYYVTPEDIYSITVRPDKTSVEVGEPVKIYLEVRKADGAPVSGLNASADVEAPDHTVYTVILSESAPGVYSGEFTNTSLVGTYSITGHVEITGVAMNAYNSFEAGTIGSRLDSIAEELRRHDSKMTALRFL